MAADPITGLRLLGGAVSWEMPTELLGLAGEPAPSSLQADAANPRQIYRTLLPGRPTSWHLIEEECCRRWKAGDRHPNDRTKLQSPAKWAEVLIGWLAKEHREAPKTTKKTVSGKLGPLLRKLAAADCQKS